MSTTTVDVQEAQAHLPELIQRAQQGEHVIIADGNTPLAVLTPVASHVQSNIPDLHPGAMRMRDDFNDPLPDSFWLGEE
jgi:prevent-host-death family protein